MWAFSKVLASPADSLPPHDSLEAIAEFDEMNKVTEGILSYADSPLDNMFTAVEPIAVSVADIVSGMVSSLESFSFSFQEILTGENKGG